jgi:ABC-type transport system involved in multi-copper enzyme maturation permease subunit
MAVRPGLGPVFAFEWLTTSRRWQVYAGRATFVAALLAAMAVVWRAEVAGRRFPSIRAQAAVGQSLYFAIVGTQLALVLLAAPAATAGSICLDKARGTLAHLLVTDLSDAEIVLGKLAARLVPVVGFVACALPVMALGTLLGGIDPVALSGAFLVTLGVALLGASLALALSVWASKTHEVLMATYAVWALWLLARPTGDVVLGWRGVSAPRWFESIDPFWLAFAPYAEPGSVAPGDFVAFFAACAGIAAALSAVAVLRVRAVSARQSGRRPRLPGPGRVAAFLRSQVRWWPGPSLDGNPVLWREWHRNRPSRWGLICGTLYVVLASVFTAMALVQEIGWGSRGELAPWVNGLQTAIGLLLLAVVAATTLAEERVRGSLDVLLATPLPTRAIVWGKWWGAYRMVPLLAVLPGVLAFALSWKNTDRWPGPYLIVGLILSYGAALTSLGLALAIWVARLGRAVALTVAAHVLVTVGWFFVVFTVRQRDLGQGLAEASPFFGAGMLTAGMAMPGGPSDSLWNICVTWAIVWIVVYATAALVLLVASLASFDRCLGRASDRPGRPRVRRPS